MVFACHHHQMFVLRTSISPNASANTVWSTAAPSNLYHSRLGIFTHHIFNRFRLRISIHFSLSYFSPPSLLLLTASVFETLRFIPPLTVSASEIDQALAVVADAL